MAAKTETSAIYRNGDVLGLFNKFVVSDMNNNFFLRMHIDLNVITWRDEEFGLFDYRSEWCQQYLFRSHAYRLDVPKVGGTLYYYIHQSTQKHSNNIHHPFKFERRKEIVEDTLPVSVTDQLDRTANYRLIGGIRIDCKEERGGKHKPIVLATTIPNKDILISGLGARAPECLPYWVVRTIKEWVIREGQVLKFGRLQMKIVQNHTSPSFFEKEGNDMADILDLDEKIEAYSLMTIQTRKCRVCYGDDDENDNTNTLINPCNCKGSIEWIHIGCLRQWLESRLTKISLQAGGNIKITNKNCCELCKMKFPTRVRRNERVISIISFLDDDSPFLSFAPVNNDELSEVDKFYVTFGEETSVRIGRQEDSGVLLTDQTVSRRHAILQISKNGPCTLTDEQSKYGTLAFQYDLPVRLGSRLHAFQIHNSVFCLTYRGIRR